MTIIYSGFLEESVWHGVNYIYICFLMKIGEKLCLHLFHILFACTFVFSNPFGFFHYNFYCFYIFDKFSLLCAQTLNFVQIY